MKNLIRTTIEMSAVLLLLTTMMLISSGITRADDSINGAKYTRCVESVERQHADDKDISIREYNAMIIECSFEWQVSVDNDDLKSM